MLLLFPHWSLYCCTQGGSFCQIVHGTKRLVMASCGVTGVHSGHIKGTLISISLLHLFPPLSTHTFERNKDKRFTRSHKVPQEQKPIKEHSHIIFLLDDIGAVHKSCHFIYRQKTLFESIKKNVGQKLAWSFPKFALKEFVQTNKKNYGIYKVKSIAPSLLTEYT